MVKRYILSEEFTHHIETILIPFFKEQGFSKIKITHYRRYIKPYVHCINLQSRSDGQALFVNLGVHLDFLPTSGKVSITPVEKVYELDCNIRWRLSSQDPQSGMWPKNPAKKQMKSIKRGFEENGIPFFEQYTSFPDIFETITLENIHSSEVLKILPNQTPLGVAMLLARINEYIGKKETAIQFSEFGLELIKDDNPRHIRPTKKVFEDIIRRCKS